MQYLYDAGHRDGYDAGYAKGKKDGLEESKKFYRNNFGDVIDNSDQQLRILFCSKHREKLNPKEKDFVDSIMHRSTVLNKTLTDAQNKWLNDIFHRIGGTKKA
jgi:hypothetical protein